MGRKATLLLYSSTLLFGLLVAGSLAQQQNKSSQEDSPKPLPYVVRVRLPNYFAQIGLSRRQRSELRKVCEQFDRKIAERLWKIRQLQEEIRKLRQEKEAACMEKLTDEQRKRLAELKEAAARRRTARRNSSDEM